MTQQDRELIIQLWNKRTPIAKIVQMLPYEPKVARRYIREVKASGALKAENRMLTQEQLCVMAWQNGMTNPHEIAETFNIKYDCVQTYLKDAKLNRKRPTYNYKKRELPEKTRQIIIEIQQGSTLTEIAKRHGVSRQLVFNIKKNYVDVMDDEKVEKAMNYFYIRVSRKTLSMDNQMFAIKQYIERNQILDYKIISDVSQGYCKKNGNKLYDLISQMNATDTLYVYDISRISRSMEELQQFNQRIFDKNINFICINQSIEEKFVKNLKGELAVILSNITELETEYISIVAKKALNKLKEQGVKLGTQPKYDDNMVAQVKELREQGLSYQEIADKLGISKSTAARLDKDITNIKEIDTIDIPMEIKLSIWADMKMGKSRENLAEKYSLDIFEIDTIIRSLRGGGHW